MAIKTETSDLSPSPDLPMDIVLGPERAGMRVSSVTFMCTGNDY